MAERRVTILALLKDQMSKPLAGIGGRFDQVRNAASELRRELQPLTGTAARFITAFAGIATLRKSFAVAREQEEAEARLFKSLSGNVELFRDLLRFSAEVQSRTVVGDEEVIRTLALLRESGVALGDLEVAFEAALQGSTALNRNIEDFSRQLVETVARGKVPEELAKFVPGIQNLSEEALRAGAAFEFVRDNFEGTAEAIADTDFGRTQQQLNRIGDILERVGNVVAAFVSEFLEAAVEELENMGDAVDEAALSDLARDMGRLAAIGVRFLPTILKIAAGILAAESAAKAFRVALASLRLGVAVVGLLANPFVAVGAAIAAVVITVGKLNGAFDGLGGEVLGVLQGMIEGAADFDDLLTVLGNRARILFIQLKGALFDPTIDFFASVTTLAENGLQVIDALVEQVFFEVAGFVSRILGTAINEVFSLIDDLTGALADFGETLGLDFASSIRTNLAVEDVLDPFERQAARAAARVDFFLQKNEESQRALAEGSKERQRQIERETRDIRIQNATILRNIELQRELGGADGDGVGGDPDIPEQDEQFRRQRERATRELERQLAQVRADENREIQEDIARQEREALERRFRDQLITAADFVAELEELQLRPLDEQIARLEEQSRANSELLQTQRAAGEDTRDALRRQIDIEMRLQRLQIERRDIAVEISDIRRELSEEILGRAETAESQLQQSIQQTASLLESGSITQTQALQRNAESTAAFREEIESLEEELITLAAVQGDVPLETVEAMLSRLGEISDRALQETATTGENVAEQLRGSLQGPLEGFFKDVRTGTQSVSEAFDDLLANMVEKLANFLASRAVQSFLEFFISSGGVVGGIAGVFTAALGLNQGGPVPGPNVNRDVVPAKLTPGEYVVKKRAVQHYGTAFMEALNAMTVPRKAIAGFKRTVRAVRSGNFQAGGQIGPAPGGGPDSVTLAFVPGDDKTVDRLLNGGKSAVLQFMEENAGDINALLNNQREVT